jgi:parallel beta-helix repeat protein
VGGDGLQSGLTIEDNVVHGNVANGMNLDGVQSSVVRNNLVYNNGRHAFRAYRIDASGGPRYLTIVNNTFVVKSGNTPVKLTEDLGGHTIFNNVLVNEGTSGGTLVAGSASGLRSDNNTFVNAGFSLNGGNSMLTLTQWRAQAGAYDLASKTSTQAELFAAPASRDYRLRSGAVAANSGVASFNGKSAPAEDIARVGRPQGAAHDHGAYENF